MTWRLSVFSLKGHHQQQQCRCVLTGEEYKIFLIHGYQNICPLLILTSVCQVVQPFTLVSNLYTLYILSQTCMLLPSQPPGETSLYGLSTPGKGRLVFLQVFCFFIFIGSFQKLCFKLRWNWATVDLRLVTDLCRVFQPPMLEVDRTQNLICNVSKAVSPRPHLGLYGRPLVIYWSASANLLM